LERRLGSWTVLAGSWVSMYAYVVPRIQVYLTETEAAALERESRLSGRTRSQLIRESIDRAYLHDGDARALQHALAKSGGAWKRREEGETSVEPRTLGKARPRAWGGMTA